MNIPADINDKKNDEIPKDISHSANDSGPSNNDKDNEKHGVNINTKKDEIIIKRSTFNKLLVIGLTSILISAFLGGFTFKTWITPTYITLPTLQDNQRQIVGDLSGKQNQLMILPTDGNKPTPSSNQPMFPSVRNNPGPSVDDDPARGNKNAPIFLIEFSDYQCPFCKRFFDESMSKIKHDYIDTGKIRHVFRDYPLPIHKNAFTAALAAQCANDQQKYWQYHDLLFENQTDWENKSSNDTILTFKGYAHTLGMNTNMFNQCLDSRKYQEEVNKDLMHGSVYGISGTPTFYIGNEARGFTQVIGAQPFSSFDNLFRFYESEQ